ncbi:hypothetical protein TNCV_2939982 [Trichonephila clavipes]|nr:hypothetical protein TNCV_2939982 [Trichonephila clavipes]
MATGSFTSPNYPSSQKHVKPIEVLSSPVGIMYMFEEGGACRGPAPRHLNVVENYEVCRSPFTALRKLKSKPNQNRTSWEWITKEMMMLKSEAV